MTSKLVRDLIPGDVLILENDKRATVKSSHRSGIFETPSGIAYEVYWTTEYGEDGYQLAPPDTEVRVEETAINKAKEVEQ